MMRTVLRAVAILITVLVALFVLTNVAAAKAARQKKPRPAHLKGSEIYTEHCSACHGPDGKGNGSSAAALKVAPPDLTTLSQRNGGTFPEDRVQRVISGDVDIDAHGSRTMPMWGSVFRSKSGAMMDSMKIREVVDYLKSIQAK
ncbi:MAG: cytochrome c [Acidobacteria bacterium]|nr:cytochrome c [Acidobacteriota bacterium]